MGRWLADPEEADPARRASPGSRMRHSHEPFLRAPMGSGPIQRQFAVRPARPLAKPSNNGLGASGSPSGLVTA